MTRERILAAAIQVADAEGLPGLTMRRIAAHLDVEAMALYHHLPNKDAVLDGVVETLVERIREAAGGKAAPGDWRAQVRHRCLAARSVMVTHPWAPALLTTRTSIPAGVYVWFDETLGVMLDGGVGTRLGHQALHSLGSMVLGFMQELFSPAAAGGSTDTEQAEEELAAMAQLLPHLTAMVAAELHDQADPELGWCDSQVEFEFTLDLILDGLERRRLREQA
ncbi:MAG: TetR/AcrR family transcriptional regulator C-terminal domain-containing protein [Kineosporiaceae bacterium]